MFPNGGSRITPRSAYSEQDYNPELGGIIETEPVPPTACGGILQEDGQKSLAWKFVGEGQGSFSPLQSYEYVGHGRGAYEKEVVVTPGKFNPQKVCICVSVPICLLLTALGIWLAVSMTAVSGSSSPASSTQAGLDYNCDEGVATWQTKWSLEQQDWCCANAGKGCPQGAASANPTQACSTQCTYMGHTATCAFRVQWGANHRFRADPNACSSAWSMVAGECPMCEACPLAATHCVPPR